MDRLLHLRLWPLVLAVLVVIGCGKGGSEAPAPTAGRSAGVPAAGRSAGVPAAGRSAGVAAAKTVDPKLLDGFCDKHWPAAGADARPFGAGPVARALDAKAVHTGRWRWINFWATWCKPCIEEMPMLGRWRDALVKQGHPFALELWTIDEDQAALDARLKQGVPAPVWHVAGAEPLGDFLETLGLDRGAVLPIHMLVDPSGQLRCVRAGSVRPADWGIIRKLVGL